MLQRHFAKKNNWNVATYPRGEGENSKTTNVWTLQLWAW